MTAKKEIRFADIRDDWYKANQLMPRLVRSVLVRSTSRVFVGFPRQWIPVFEYFGLQWTHSSPPTEFMPIVSGMSETQVLMACRSARSHGLLRTLVESIVVLDPVLADFLYIVDNSLSLEENKVDSLLAPSNGKTVRLTNWQAYGRPEIRQLETEIDSIVSSKSTAVVLPCSRSRPYRRSRTHKRIWQRLHETSCELSRVHQIVLSSLGVLPEELWENPTVMNYDAGVPDIYRLVRLARRYFSRNRYKAVIDCLEFEPYSDILSILAKEHIIGNLTKGPVRRSRQFYLRS